jgi:SAM-dependent methyltransferase
VSDPQRDPDGEAERIGRVYERYRSSPSHVARHTSANPGNRAIVAERDRAVDGLLREIGLAPLAGRRVLDVGCGFGHELARMEALGASAADMFGVDVVPERVGRAKQAFPLIDFRVGNAEALEFPDESFDLVLCYTLFSSILDDEPARHVAAEIERVLRPGGALAWFDIRYPNPANRNLRAVPAHAVKELFPALTPHLRTVTLLPPLARRLGGLTPVAYPLLARAVFLRSHLAGVLVKGSRT